MALGMGLSKDETKKASVGAAADEEGKCLASGADGEGEEPYEGA